MLRSSPGRPPHAGPEPRRLCRPPLPPALEHVAQRELVRQSVLLRPQQKSTTRREI